MEINHPEGCGWGFAQRKKRWQRADKKQVPRRWRGIEGGKKDSRNSLANCACHDLSESVVHHTLTVIRDTIGRYARRCDATRSERPSRDGKSLKRSRVMPASWEDEGLGVPISPHWLTEPGLYPWNWTKVASMPLIIPLFISFRQHWLWRKKWENPVPS